MKKYDRKCRRAKHDVLAGTSKARACYQDAVMVASKHAEQRRKRESSPAATEEWFGKRRSDRLRLLTFGLVGVLAVAHVGLTTSQAHGEVSVTVKYKRLMSTHGSVYGYWNAGTYPNCERDEFTTPGSFSSDFRISVCQTSNGGCPVAQRTAALIAQFVTIGLDDCFCICTESSYQDTINMSYEIGEISGDTEYFFLAPAGKFALVLPSGIATHRALTEGAKRINIEFCHPSCSAESDKQVITVTLEKCRKLDDDDDGGLFHIFRGERHDLTQNPDGTLTHLDPSLPRWQNVDSSHFCPCGGFGELFGELGRDPGGESCCTDSCCNGDNSPSSGIFFEWAKPFKNRGGWASYEGEWLSDLQPSRSHTSHKLIKEAHPMVQLPGLPLLPAVPNNYFSDVDKSLALVTPDTCTAPEVLKRAELEVERRGTHMRYKFVGRSKCTELTTLKKWLHPNNGNYDIKESLWLDVAYHNGTVQTTKELGYGDSDGRVAKWVNYDDTSISVDFQYDGPGEGALATKVLASDGQVRQYDWETQIYGPNNETTTAHITHVDNDCAECPAYDYEYDTGRLTLIIDNNTGHTLSGFEYGTDPLDGNLALTKKYRKASGGSEVVLYKANYSATGDELTHYYYQTGLSSKAVTELFDADGNGALTKRRHYSSLNPDLSTGYDEFTYDYDYNAGGTLTHKTETLPLGNRMHTYLGVDDVDLGEVTKVSIDDETTEITMEKYGFTKVADTDAVLTKFSDVRDAETIYSYSYEDDKFRLTQRTDPTVAFVGGGTGQQTTFYAYDSEWKRTAVWRKDGEGANVTTAYEYGDFDNLTQTIEDSGVGGLQLATKFAYDEASRVTQTIDPRGVTHVSIYLTNGALERSYTLDGSGPNAVELTYFAYDAGLRISMEVASVDGTISSPASYCGGSGTCVKTTYDYDAFNRLTRERLDPSGLDLTTDYAYDDQDRLIKTTSPDDTYTVVERDGRDRTIRVVTGYDGGGASGELTTTWEYDGNSNNTLQQSPNDMQMEYEYDLYDRLTKSVRTAP